MIKRLALRLDAAPYQALDSELTVKLHGYLMTRILPVLAEAYHSNDVRPYSQYLRKTAEKGIYSGQLGILREDAESLADVLIRRRRFASAACGSLRGWKSCRLISLICTMRSRRSAAVVFVCTL